MSDAPKRVRREDKDWPSAKEIERDLAELLYSGKPPFEKWAPTQDVDQALKIAQGIANERGLNFDLTWRHSIPGHVFREWEGRFHRLNAKASRAGDYKNAVTEYWAMAKKGPAMAVCRCILNMLEGVQEREYMVKDL
jgi:hypothetical protein